MDKEFLSDYEAKEKEEIKIFGEKFSKGNITYEDRYPQSYRFKLNEPYSKSIIGEKIWNQIPLYETTIIVLNPTKKDIFEKVHGFDIEDIERLIDFAKKTGKIQFALAEYPTHYIKMDFLEPLFRELKPPKLIHIPLDWIATNIEIEKSYGEMEYLLENQKSSDFIMEYIKNKYPESAISQNYVEQGIIYDLIRLKLSGYENIYDFIQTLMKIGTTEIMLLLESIHDLFLYPYDPLKGIKSFKQIDMYKLHQQFNFNEKRKIELPCEIGKFLNNKLKLIIPKNFDGAIELSDEYNLYDLRKVMRSLNEAVDKHKIELINEKSSDISIIFENVWNDANKLKRRINISRHAISFGVAVIGSVVTLPLGTIGGLLSGLGFEVIDKYLDTKAYESISEKIIRLGTESHIMHIYDFKKKHRLP